MIKVNIKKARKLKNISQRELAKKAGTSQSYISEIETGATSSPTLDLIEAICTVLEVCPLDILECDCKYKDNSST